MIVLIHQIVLRKVMAWVDNGLSDPLEVHGVIGAIATGGIKSGAEVGECGDTVSGVIVVERGFDPRRDCLKEEAVQTHVLFSPIGKSSPRCVDGDGVCSVAVLVVVGLWYGRSGSVVGEEVVGVGCLPRDKGVECHKPRNERASLAIKAGDRVLAGGIVTSGGDGVLKHTNGEERGKAEEAASGPGNADKEPVPEVPLVVASEVAGAAPAGPKLGCNKPGTGEAEGAVEEAEGAVEPVDKVLDEEDGGVPQSDAACMGGK